MSTVELLNSKSVGSALLKEIKQLPTIALVSDIPTLSLEIVDIRYNILIKDVISAEIIEEGL